jgi:hypothetical protein
MARNSIEMFYVRREAKRFDTAKTHSDISSGSFAVTHNRVPLA